MEYKEYMPNFEPIPGQSEPTPEKGPGGVEVNYVQPKLLYLLAKDSKAEPYDPSLSRKAIGDRLFLSENTRLIRHAKDKEYHPEPYDVYGVDTWLYLSPFQIRYGHRGYYTPDRTTKIITNLQNLRIPVQLDTIINGQQRLKIYKPGGNYGVEILLGWPSIEASRKYHQLSPSLYEYKGGVEEVIKKNDYVSLRLVNKNRLDTGSKLIMRLQVPEEEIDFEKQLAFYTEILEKFLIAAYQEAGIIPDLELTLRPPVLNQDTLTEIKSTETTQPRLVVPEQIKTDMPSFDEIAGQDEAVKQAKRLVLAINHPEVYEKRGIKRPKGILFYGPPGTGKTLLAKAISKETQAQFFEVSAADTLTKWYGESARLMQEVFNRANRAVSEGRKVVIFFDELDALAPSREGVHEETQKVISIMLQNMDGMKANPNVTIVAATNRPLSVDPALRRPGRFDKLIHVATPNERDREAILKVHIEKSKKSATSSEQLFANDLDLTQVAASTEGMVGAELANLINLTLEEKATTELEGEEWTPVATQELIDMAKKLGYLKEEKRRIGFLPSSPSNYSSSK